MFITLTLYKNTNRVRVNVNNISYYKMIKADSVFSQEADTTIEVYKTGIYFPADPIPLVVEEDTIVIDNLIKQLLSSNNETVI